jgi:hypothetical protein
MSTLSKLLLEHRCEIPMSDDERAAIMAQHNIASLDSISKTKDHPMWTKLYYGEQPKKAWEHLAKLGKDFPAQAAIFALGVSEMLAKMAQDESDRLEKKAAMQARRDARAVKAAKGLCWLIEQLDPEGDASVWSCGMIRGKPRTEALSVHEMTPFCPSERKPNT